MRIVTADRLSRWVNVAGLVLLGFALAAFSFAMAPWSAAVMATLAGVWAATRLVFRNRAVPTLAEVISVAKGRPRRRGATPDSTRGPMSTRTSSRRA